MLRTITICLLLPTLVLAQAQPATEPAETESLSEIRTYNVGDLLKPDQKRPWQKDEIPSGQSPPAMAPMVDTGALVKVIQELVDTDSWRENGGEIGQIQVLGPTLVIKQTPANHDQILNLLQQVRAEQGPMQLLNLRAYWLLLDSDDVRTLTDAAAKSGQPFAIVPDEMLSDERIYSVAQASTFSGSELKLGSKRERAYIHDVTPIVAQNAVGYDPQPNDAISGARLRVTPQLQPDGQVVVELHSLVSEIDEISQALMPANVSDPATAPAKAGLIDLPNMLNHDLETTLRVPAGKRVLVGGMTLDPAGKAKPLRQLYLVMQIDVAR
jgi:hypothetical protein